MRSKIVLVHGIITPNVKDVHGGMEEDFNAAMSMLQEWEKAGTLKLRVQAQPMFKSTVGDPQRFVDFGVKIVKNKVHSTLSRR